MFWISKLSTNEGINKSNKKYFIVLGMAFVLVISVTFFNVLIPTYLLQLAFVLLALILII
jgi:Flp pilus assembly protein TadB